jgi:hypothetical protein
MPYFISNTRPECPAWAVVKEDGDIIACHDSEQSATSQMVAISISEGIDPGGSYEKAKREGRI